MLVYVFPNQIRWKKYYKNINNLYQNEKIKLIRQILIFLLMMYIYFTIFNFLVLKKNNIKLRKGLFVSSLLYIYILLVGTLAAGTEQERILYTGFVINVLFFILFFKKI